MKLDPGVAALVLLSAFLHASWNAIVKSDRDQLLSLALVLVAGMLIALAALPFVPPPTGAAWRYLALSAVVHNTYQVLLLRSYAHGDLSHVYPIARGIAPLLVAGASGRLVGEHLAAGELAGVALLSLGILSLTFGDGLPRGSAWRPTVLALLTGLAIAAYTVLDGLGARRAGSAFGYIAWLNVLQGPWMMLVAIQRRGRALLPTLARGWWRGMGGGVIATLGYGIVIWALGRGAIAHVAALRESSVLFAALMGMLLLNESFGVRRVLASTVVVAGLVLMNVTPGG